MALRGLLELRGAGLAGGCAAPAAAPRNAPAPPPPPPQRGPLASPAPPPCAASSSVQWASCAPSNRHGRRAAHGTTVFASRSASRAAAAAATSSTSPPAQPPQPPPTAPPSTASAHSLSQQDDSSSYPHVPVMLGEVLAAFQPVALHTYLDCTLGAGGHASELVAAHPEMRLLLGLDTDPTAHALAGPRVRAAAAGRQDFSFVPLHGNYRDVGRLLAAASAPAPAPRPNAILMDLGVSSMQFDTAERGFSFMRDGPLDMRMDPNAALSAEQLVNSCSEAELGRILRDYGEEKLWKVVARRIAEAREVEPLRTTQQLVRAVGYTHAGGGKRGRKGGIHPATRTFQALRIAVNDELRRLEEALPAAIAALAPGGRLAVISFHSLEDRLVKHAFLRAVGKPTPDIEHLTYGANKYGYLEQLEASAVAELVSRKPVLPSEQECGGNPRARSAKLRVLQKLP